MAKFIYSVGDVVLRNPADKSIIAIGTTAIDASFALTATSAQVRGGRGNAVLFSYITERTFDVTINQASFNKEVLALNAGSLIETGLVQYLYTECIDLNASGVGTLTKTPLGSVTAIANDNRKFTVTPVGGQITIAELAGQSVNVAYMVSAQGEKLSVGSSVPPSVVDMIYTAEVRDENNTVVEYMQIHVPKLQLSGNYTLSFNASGVANESITGTALSTSISGCSDGAYAEIMWIPASGSSVASFTMIAAIPSDWDVSVAAGLPQSKQIEVLGVYTDGIHANVNITDECSFAMDTGSDPTITVSAGGLVTVAASAIAGDSGTVVVTHTSTGLTDCCIFNVVA